MIRRIGRLKDGLARADEILASLDEQIALIPFDKKAHANKLQWQQLRADLIDEIHRCESIELPSY